jgi:RNA polymerase sporulation-specific sigma factor
MASRAEMRRLLRAGDVEGIVQAFEPTVRAVAKLYFGPGLDQGDLRQEARWGIAKAVRDFHGPPDMFPGFARLCCTRQVITAVKTATRVKHQALNHAMSLDAPDDAGAEPFDDSIIDRLLVRFCDDPCRIVIAREEVRLLLWRMGTLSPWEREVVRRVAMLGEAYEEVELKSVDNALQRARRKLRGLPPRGTSLRTAA